MIIQKSSQHLAQVNGPIAHRFEIYIKGIEIANGYQELLRSEELSIKI